MLTTATIHETITEESAAIGDVATSELTEDTPISFRDALCALQNGSWDYVDWGSDRVIAYPADWHHDMHTGDYDSETLVIRGPANQLEMLARALDES